MGTLVAMHYPTTIALKLADHTYVECGTGGRAWACWGGKTGGMDLRAAAGSSGEPTRLHSRTSVRTSRVI